MIRPDEYFVLFTCGLGIVMSVGFFVARPLNLRNILLGIILLPLTYIQFCSFLLTTKLIYKIPDILYTQMPFGIIIAPLLFLYVRTFLQENRSLILRDVLHFIIPVLMGILIIPKIALSTKEKILHINSIYEGFSEFSIIAAVSMAIFLTYSVVLAVKIAGVFHRENPLHKRLLMVFLFLLSWIILTIAKITGIITGFQPVSRWANFLFSVEILLLYYGFQKMPFLLNYANITIKKPKSRLKSLLSTVDIENLKNEIELMMDKEKLYCDEDLSLGRLAHALEITSHQLSEFLNEHYGKNFNAFINSYRIQYALSLLNKDPDSSTLSVAFACGFNSYSAFYSAFKKETGRPPGEYKNNNKIA